MNSEVEHVSKFAILETRTNLSKNENLFRNFEKGINSGFLNRVNLNLNHFFFFFLFSFFFFFLFPSSFPFSFSLLPPLTTLISSPSPTPTEPTLASNPRQLVCRTDPSLWRPQSRLPARKTTRLCRVSSDKMRGSSLLGPYPHTDMTFLMSYLAPARDLHA